MCTREGNEKGLITGGKDGFIFIWSDSPPSSDKSTDKSSIYLVKKIDLKEFKLFNCKVMAIAENPRN